MGARVRSSDWCHRPSFTVAACATARGACGDTTPVLLTELLTDGASQGHIQSTGQQADPAKTLAGGSFRQRPLSLDTTYKELIARRAWVQIPPPLRTKTSVTPEVFEFLADRVRCAKAPPSNGSLLTGHRFTYPFLHLCPSANCRSRTPGPWAQRGPT